MVWIQWIHVRNKDTTFRWDVEWKLLEKSTFKKSFQLFSAPSCVFCVFAQVIAHISPFSVTIWRFFPMYRTRGANNKYDPQQYVLYTPGTLISGCNLLMFWAEAFVFFLNVSVVLIGRMLSLFRHLLLRLLKAPQSSAASSAAAASFTRTQRHKGFCCVTNWGLCRRCGQIRIQGCVCVVMFIKTFLHGLGQRRARGALHNKVHAFHVKCPFKSGLSLVTQRRVVKARTARSVKTV